MSAAPEVRVEHDEAGHRFVGYVDGDALAHLGYARRGDALDLLHTEVDERARGQGVGEAVVRQVLDEARARGDRVVASCPFVAAYVRRHREYQDLLAPR